MRNTKKKYEKIKFRHKAQHALINQGTFSDLEDNNWTKYIESHTSHKWSQENLWIVSKAKATASNSASKANLLPKGIAKHPLTKPQLVQKTQPPAAKLGTSKATSSVLTLILPALESIQCTGKIQKASKANLQHKIDITPPLVCKPFDSLTERATKKIDLWTRRKES